MVHRIIDIMGTVAILALLLKYGTAASDLISQTGATASDFYRTVSLQS